MKVSIYEQLPVKLKHRFAGTDYEVYTVRDMNWLGMRNGELLRQMVLNHFHVLITNDKLLHYQQQLRSSSISIVNINTKTNDYEDVMLVLDQILNLLSKIHKLIGVGKIPGPYFILS